LELVMTFRSSPTCVLLVLSGLAAGGHAALVCTPGDALGAGSCTEVVSAAPIGTTSFANQTIAIDFWQSNAAPGFVETLQDVRFTFGGTVDYGWALLSAGLVGLASLRRRRRAGP
jgi:MYXO-CTERM domain-containing protein